MLVCLDVGWIYGLLAYCVNGKIILRFIGYKEKGMGESLGLFRGNQRYSSATVCLCRQPSQPGQVCYSSIVATHYTPFSLFVKTRIKYKYKKPILYQDIGL